MESARLHEALREQGIYVHESDPVLDIGAICELAVADTVKAIEGLNKAAADRISAAAAQHIEAARQSASILITEAGRWFAEQLREAAGEISASILKELRPEVMRAEAAARLRPHGLAHRRDRRRRPRRRRRVLAGRIVG